MQICAIVSFVVISRLLEADMAYKLGMQFLSVNILRYLVSVLPLSGRIMMLSLPLFVLRCNDTIKKIAPSWAAH